MNALFSALAISIVVLGVVLAGTSVRAQTEAPAIALTGPAVGTEVGAVRETLASFSLQRGIGFHDLTDATPTGAIDLSGELELASADYAAFRYADAITKLVGLEGKLATSGGAGLSRRQIADLFILRAMSRNETSDLKGFHDDLVQAATIFPSYALDEARFRPSLRAAFERARDAVVKGATADVTLALDPGCVVYVDSELASSGGEVALRPGVHYLRGRCAGFEPFALLSSFGPGINRFEPSLSAVRESRAVVLAAAKVALVIWVNASRTDAGRIELELVEVSSGKTERRWSLRVVDRESAKAVEDVLVSLIETRFSPPAPAPITVIKEPQRPWYQSNWVWLGVGALAATAIIVPFALRETAPTGWGADLEGPP